MLLGWLIYRNPNWINPYGEMPPERKALVDIEGLKRAVAITFGVAGGLMIVAGLLSAFKVIDDDTSGLVMMAICLAMAVPLFIAMRRCNGFGRDENGEGYYSLYMNKAAKITAVIVMVVMVAVVVFLSIIMSKK
jgi:hypothetical protein